MTARPRFMAGGAMPIGAFAASIGAGSYDRNSRARLSRGDSPRSGQPVWRNSYYVGQIEDRIWKPINGGSRRGGKRFVAALFRAAKKLELETLRKRRETDPGARNGALGEVGLAVLEYLYATVDFATGRLEPALRTIATEIGRSYSAVHRALDRLRRRGFLHWMRRSEPIEDPEPGGPMVKQVSNAYGLLCPPGMAGWLRKLFRGPPTPECEADRRKREKGEFEHMIDGLTAGEALSVTWTGDRLLGETLAKFAAGIDARESHEGESSRSDETGEMKFIS